MAAGFPTKANWAAGDILTAAQMDDLAATVNLYSPAGVTSGYVPTANGTSNSITWVAQASGAPYVSGKNWCINGSMDVWQRGTSFIGTAYNYSADRWLEYRSAFAAGMTVTQSTTVPANFKYSMKVQRDSGNTGTGDLIVRQALESVNSIPMAGQTVSLSFYAKAGANFSPTSSILISRIYTGTGTDQAANNMTGWTGVITTSQNNTLTTSFQRFTQTLAIPAGVTQIGIEFDAIPTGTAGADDSYYVTGVQLEVGTTASAFSRSHGDIQGELAACQRYYWRSNTAGNNYPRVATGMAYSSTIAGLTVPLPVSMRTIPSAVEYSGLQVTDTVNFYAVTATTLNSANSSPNFVAVDFTVASGLTQFRAYYTGQTSSSGYLGLTAEL